MSGHADSEIDTDEIDDAIEMAENFTAATAQVIRGELPKIYSALSASSCKVASEIGYPWLVRRMRNAPNFEKYWKEVPNQSNPHSPFIVAKEQDLISLHFAVASIFQTGPAVRRSGLEMVLAYAIENNTVFGEKVARASKEDVPLSASDLASMSLGDAMRSIEPGVYALLWHKANKFIIGFTVMRGFAARLGAEPYSRSYKLVEAIGAANQDADRHNFILFLPEGRAANRTNRCWMTPALETLGIVAFHSTSGHGLNTNAVDPRFHFSGFTHRELGDMWAAHVQAVLDGHKIPPMWSRHEPDMEAEPGSKTYSYHTWFRDHVAPKIGFKASVEVTNQLVRKIAPLAEENNYAKFPPIPREGWLQNPPLRRGNRGTFLKDSAKVSAKRSGGRPQLSPSAWILEKKYDWPRLAAELMALDGEEDMAEVGKRIRGEGAMPRRLKSAHAGLPSDEDEEL